MRNVISAGIAALALSIAAAGGAAAAERTTDSANPRGTAVFSNDTPPRVDIVQAASNNDSAQPGPGFVVSSGPLEQAAHLISYDADPTAD